MKAWVWIRGWWDDLRDSLWLVPAAVVAVSAGAASLLARFDAAGLPDTLVFGGTPDGARAVLSVLAGATITVTGLVFSLTVVALQMASSQFTPRLLRTFLRDRATQIVLSGMLGSSVFHVAVLRTVRSDGDGAEAFVPRLAVSLSLLYSLFAVGLLVFFLHHVTQHMRVDVVMRKIAKEAVARVSAVDDVELPDREPIDPPSDADVVVARRGGYLQRVEVQQLTSHARKAQVRVRLRPAIGAWVTEGTVLAWWWHDAPPGAGAAERDQQPAALDGEDASSLVHASVHLGSDRTESNDVSFGIRQLVDIALRALSTGVNDPSTARQAIEQITDVLAAASGSPLGAQQTLDADGQVRISMPRPTFAALLALGIDQIRMDSGGDPDVTVALLALCTDLGERVADDATRRDAVAAHVDRIMAAVSLPDPDDRERVERAADRARATLSEGRRQATETEAG